MKNYYTKEIISILFDELAKFGVQNIGWVVAKLTEYAGEEGMPQYDVLVGPGRHCQGIRLMIYCIDLDGRDESYRASRIKQEVATQVIPKIKTIWREYI